MKVPVRFYYDLMSQPSRALYMFLKMTKIPFEDHQIALRKGEENTHKISKHEHIKKIPTSIAAGVHLTKEYHDNVNRFEKVPAIIDNGFQLSESVAIFRYLAAKYPDLSASLYPTDLERRGRIDEYLEWQHANTRMTCSYYFILKYLKPRTAGREAGDEQIVMSSLRQLDETLDQMEDLWLTEDEGTFLGGQKECSIADLLAACELEQPSIKLATIILVLKFLMV